MVSHGETPAGLPDVIILEESIAATARRAGQRCRRTRICQVLLKLSTVALRPDSPFGMKTRWMPKRRCNRMTWERL
jgi:hypothetical protein